MKTLPIEKMVVAQEDAIEDKMDEIDEKVEQLENNKESLKNRKDLLKEKKNVLVDVMEDPTREHIRVAMDVALCYGHIAYCCASNESPLTSQGKQCPFRDSLLSALGMDAEDYEKWKLDGVSESFWDLLERKDKI